MEHNPGDMAQPEGSASLSDWEQQHRGAEEHGAVSAAEGGPHEQEEHDRTRLDAERDMASLYAHAGLGTTSDFTALHGMDEHSQLLADFAMTAQEGSASREGFYEPGNPMHEAFSNQHQDQHEGEASEAERHAHEIAARMLENANTEQAQEMAHDVAGGSGSSTPRRGKERSGSAPTKTSRGRKADGNPLTAAQKKINHIVSEQRRRASIRRGYELLCQEIPALRMAPLVNGAQRGGSGPGGGGAVGGRKRERDALLGVKSPVIKRRRGNKHVEYTVGNSAEHYGEAGRHALGMEALLQAQQQEQDGGERPAIELSAIGSDGRSGPRSENNVLNKTIEYIRSMQINRLQLLDRLHALRQVAQSRFPPSQHEDLLLRPQTVANIVIVEPPLPSLKEFIKQYNDKAALGQVPNAAKRKRGGRGAQAEAVSEAMTQGDPNMVVADVQQAAADGSRSEETEIKGVEPQLQTILVDWEDVWKGGQMIDDEEEADNAANTT